jgi:DNA-binding NtrC family response regulator
MDPAFLHHLRHYAWRGNVRELKNVLERAVILADEELLTTDTLPTEFQQLSSAEEADDSRSLRAMEKRQIRLVLQETAGNKTEAARQLGIGLKTLYRKIDEYGL